MFETLIGQEKIKNKLSFYTKVKKSGGITPPIMFNGAKGLGKTEFAKQFSRGIGRPILEINCGTIRNAAQFFEQVFLTVIQDKEIAILFDEYHALPKDLEEVFLTAFNTEGAKTKEVSIGDGFATFDFTQQTFLFATTEMHKIFEPLKDRMTVVDFVPYQKYELAGIIKNKFDWVNYESGLLDEIAGTVRGNARSAVKRALEIKAYCNIKNTSNMTFKRWEDLKVTLDIRPFGLSNIEVEILKTLKEHGECSLQMLSAITGMSRSALQKDAENNLLRCGFLKIDGKRHITSKGQKILETL